MTVEQIHEHVLTHRPWTYCDPVTDGTQRLLHIGCPCGHDTHAGEVVAWTPSPPASDGTVCCAWPACGQWFTPHAGQQRYHSAVCYGRADALRRKAAKLALKDRRIASHA